MPLGAFIGRSRELEHGFTLLDSAAAGSGQLLLVSGEPGIGKSRFADELAKRARDLGFHVTWGRCWEAGGAPAYWPWVQSLRSLMSGAHATELQTELSTAAPAMGQLLPDFVRAAPGVLVSSDPDVARFQMFDSVTAVLKRAARLQPLMVVLDDLQVADTPSLLLLRFVAGLVGDERLLLVATYRDTDPALRDPLAETVADLLRSPAASRIALRGIAEIDAPRFIEAVTGLVPEAGLAQIVHRETNGNPLFLTEVSRVLLDEGQLSGQGLVKTSRVPVPRSVQDLIERRMRGFSEETVHLLQLASVLGREFSTDALAALASRSPAEVLDSLQCALDEQILTEVPDARARMRFGHVLIRECLYESVPRTQRRELHREALARLESLYRSDLEPHLSELAHHAHEGTSGAGDRKAIAYAQRAGDQALSQLAYEEAARQYQLALDGTGQGSEADLSRRCELLLSLGDALTRAGDEAAAKASFLHAAECARAIGQNDYLASAALGYATRQAWTRAGADRQLIPLLEAAVHAVGEEDSVIRARLLSRLAGALRDSLDRMPREKYAEEAVALARRLDDANALAYALDGFLGATWHPDNPLRERMVIADEIVRLGEAAGDPETQLWGHVDRVCTYFEMGDLRSAVDEIRWVQNTAGALRQPEMRWLAACNWAVLALIEGRFEEAETLISTALEVGRRSRPADVFATYAGQMFQLRREQGRLDEIADLVESAADEFEWYPMFRCELAITDVERGRELRARGALETLCANDFARLPFDNYWLINMALLGELAHVLCDAGAAAAIYERLLPYANRNAYVAPDGCLGSISRVLGLLAHTLSRPAAAARHYEDAMDHNQRMGARPWVVHTQYAFGSLLMEGGDSAHRERGYALLAEASRACDELGMPVLRDRVAAALASAPAAARTTRTTEVNRITLEADYWALTYGSQTVRLHDSKGLRILAQLLREPDRPHPSIDLERPGEEGDTATARAIAASDAGELLDDEARRTYRARIAELRTAIDDAETSTTPANVDALRDELEFITRELSRAVGIGGRARRAGSATERARLNVSRAVKTALQRVADVHPALAAHLNATVRTGTVCIYAPDPRSPIVWSD